MSGASSRRRHAREARAVRLAGLVAEALLQSSFFLASARLCHRTANPTTWLDRRPLFVGARKRCRPRSVRGGYALVRLDPFNLLPSYPSHPHRHLQAVAMASQ